VRSILANVCARVAIAGDRGARRVWLRLQITPIQAVVETVRVQAARASNNGHALARVLAMSMLTSPTPARSLLAAGVVGASLMALAPACSSADEAIDGDASAVPDASVESGAAADGSTSSDVSEAGALADGATTPTCKQAGGTRCATSVAACAGMKTLAASDCAACCVVPTNPVYGKSAPDPFILRDGTTYHAFATGKNITHLTSSDLAVWTLAKDALTPGPWADQNVDHWAPTAYQAKNGTWVMFYAGLVAGTGKHCLGRATSTSAAGTFVDTSATPFVCYSNMGWSLDPSVFQDMATGKDYLVWRQDTPTNNAGTVYESELDPAGRLTGATTELIHRATTEPSWEFDANGGVMENPAMIRAGGTYHLFYAGFRWQTAGYAVGHATCTTPAGPCTKTSTTSPWQGSLGKMLGPGGADFVTTADGTLLMYMHGWQAPDVGPGVGTRALWLYRFDAKANTSPTVGDL
jgi:hypothetical protein